MSVTSAVTCSRQTSNYSHNKGFIACTLVQMLQSFLPIFSRFLSACQTTKLQYILIKTTTTHFQTHTLTHTVTATWHTNVDY